MADDPGTPPAPRPRRRRTDHDPSFKPPKVANERRRTKKPAPAAADPTAATAATEPVQPPESAADSAPTGATPFHTPGMTPAAPSTPAARAGSSGTQITSRWSGLPVLEDRSPNPSVCPFLRSVDGDAIRAPVERPDAANRCAALREAVPQSLRQQELVCLAIGHVNCPRYLRGAVVVTEQPKPAIRARRPISPSILVSIVILIGAFAASAAFVVSRGSLELAAAPSRSPEPSASSVAAASPDGSPSVAPTPLATASPLVSATPAPSATPSPAATATPTSSPEPTATPTPAPTPTPTPQPEPTSDRYDLLEPCPNADDCWIYTVRSGDNLFSIANYFGVPLARVYAMNPWLESTGLRAGQQLRLPPPTR